MKILDLMEPDDEMQEYISHEEYNRWLTRTDLSHFAAHPIKNIFTLFKERRSHLQNDVGVAVELSFKLTKYVEVSVWVADYLISLQRLFYGNKIKAKTFLYLNHVLISGSEDDVRLGVVLCQASPIHEAMDALKRV